jgi:predicted DNA-binding transcriptional regulator YafY
MNQSKSAFRRYKVIDGLLRNKMRKYPSMNDIIDACWEKLDYQPSKETIQKDIANMKSPYPDGFDAPICFNRTHLGYEYTDTNYSLAGISMRPEDLEAFYEAVDVIQAIGGSSISEKFNHAVEKLFSASLEKKQEERRKPILQTMTPPISRGFEYFDLFYAACNEKKPVSFIHFSYKKRTFNHILIHPFLIKEFDNRWYIIGYSEFHQSVRTFGLDRISEPVMLKKDFIKTDIDHIQEYLQDVYGVFPIPKSKKELVEIHVSQLGTHYLQAYPIHQSQKINKSNDGSSLITFDIIPSVELARYCLSQGRHVEILKPSWFKQFTNELTE